MKIYEDLLTPNSFSRPEIELKKCKGIVVHWVANPQTTAMQNKNFFESRKDGKKGYGSAHYIVDLNGDILRCIPENEIAYHVGANVYNTKALQALGDYPNASTIGIECTHIDNTGMMTGSTYNSLIALCVRLCRKYKLNPETDMYRHYDVTGKECHKFFVDNPVEWEKLKKIVLEKI